MRRLASLSLFSLLAASAACADKQPTAIVVALSTEGRVPDELAELQLVVRKGSDARFDQTYPLEADKPLPGTVTLTDDGDPDVPRSILVQARPTGAAGKWIVVRRATLAFQKEHVKLLRMPLRYSCFDFDCPETQTCKAGVCVSPEIAPESLPEFESNEQVVANAPPAAVSTSGAPAKCFDPSVCLGSPVEIPRECTFPLPGEAGKFNVALKWVKGKQLAVLDVDAEEGFTVEGSTVKLAPGLCTAVKDPTRVASMVVSQACATKPSGAPVCVPTSQQGQGGAAGAAGASGSGGAGAGGAGGAGNGGAGNGGAGNGGAGNGGAGNGGAGNGGAGAAGASGGGAAGVAGAAGGGGSGGAGAAGASGGGAAGTGGTGGAGAGGIAGGGAGGLGGSSGAAGIGGGGMSGAGGGPAGSGGAAGCGVPTLPYPELCNGLDDDGDGCVDEDDGGSMCALQFPTGAQTTTFLCQTGKCMTQTCSSGTNTNSWNLDGCESNGMPFDPMLESALFDVRGPAGLGYLVTYQDAPPNLLVQTQGSGNLASALVGMPTADAAIVSLRVGAPTPEIVPLTAGTDSFNAPPTPVTLSMGKLPAAATGNIGTPSFDDAVFAYTDTMNHVQVVETAPVPTHVGAAIDGGSGVYAGTTPVAGHLGGRLHVAWIDTTLDLRTASFDGSSWMLDPTLGLKADPATPLVLTGRWGTYLSDEPVVLYRNMSGPFCKASRLEMSGTWAGDGCWTFDIVRLAAGYHPNPQGNGVSWLAMVAKDVNDEVLVLDTTLDPATPLGNMTELLPKGPTPILGPVGAVPPPSPGDHGYILFSRGGGLGGLKIGFDLTFPSSAAIEQALVPTPALPAFAGGTGFCVPPK